jgi:hypothetical protein
MKYWETIADNLSKAGWSWGCVSTVDFGGGERSGLLMRTATTESVSLCVPMKADCVYGTRIGDSVKETRGAGALKIKARHIVLL